MKIKAEIWIIDMRPFGSCRIGKIKPQTITLESEDKGKIRGGRKVSKEGDKWFYVIRR